jgi:hypothetical protein
MFYALKHKAPHREQSYDGVWRTRGGRFPDSKRYVSGRLDSWQRTQLASAFLWNLGENSISRSLGLGVGIGQASEPVEYLKRVSSA